MAYKRILHVVGARPNFVKAAPVLRAMTKANHCVIHTGQHGDPSMSDAIFHDLGYWPDVTLGLRKVPDMIRGVQREIAAYQPDVVFVYGDTNSTLAGAIAAHRLGVPLAHVEAGLRSGDWSMPEESNRYVVDELADIRFASCADATKNLLDEGHSSVMVGNVMIDQLAVTAAKARCPREEKYGVITLHRPFNVDTEELYTILRHIAVLPTNIIFPAHPRTAQWLTLATPANTRLMPPLSYAAFVAETKFAAFVITDSGGVQEETTFLDVPCFTLRPNTERPVTISQGTNRLVINLASLPELVEAALAGDRRHAKSINGWDGHAAERIAKYLEDV